MENSNSHPFLPFALPFIDEKEINEVVDSLKSGWITTGPKCQAFEKKFAEKIGCRHAIAVNSATAGLHLALEAAGVKPKDAVITVPLTFAATAEVIRYFQADPIFIDVQKADGNMDPRLLKEFLETRCEVTDGVCYLKAGRQPVKAVIPVHFAGLPCDMDPIIELARTFHLMVVDDAAHAFPTLYKGRMIGTISAMTVFSFYATKTITTGEGGMITTNDDALAERMRIMRLHGISKDAWKRYTAEGSWYYEIVAPGFKYNLTDIAAAMGLHQLDKADWMLEVRKQYAKLYSKAFESIPELEIPWEGAASDQHAWHLYVLRLRPGLLNINRAKFIEELKGLGIGTSVHFIPLHLHPYYRETYGFKKGDFPVSEDLFERAISLPLYPKMTEADVQRVIEAVKTIVQRSKQ